MVEMTGVICMDENANNRGPLSLKLRFERHELYQTCHLIAFGHFWVCSSSGLEDREEKARALVLIWPRAEIEPTTV